LQFDERLKRSQRITIFFSDENIKFIEETKTWIVDGTFRSSPQYYFQLLTFQGLLFGRYIPLIFILLTENSEEIYSKAFDTLNTIINFCPEVILCDFEQALINSCKK
jgi:hypothetical protein